MKCVSGTGHQFIVARWEFTPTSYQATPYQHATNFICQYCLLAARSKFELDEMMDECKKQNREAFPANIANQNGKGGGRKEKKAEGPS